MFKASSAGLARLLLAMAFGVVVTVSAGACRVDDGGLIEVSTDDDDDVAAPGGQTGAGGSGGTSGGGRPVADRCDPPEELLVRGEACTCHDACESGHCVDGVCCASACDQTCEACNVQGSEGSCAAVPAGELPPDSRQCEALDPSTCGTDGTCDGNRGCRLHPDGTVCKAGRCEGDSVTDVFACQAGACEPGANIVCSPFGCNEDTSSCYAGCFNNGQCAMGESCEGGSCGKKLLGAVCDADAECKSGSCADGVCCSTACDGACVSCNQTGSVGSCEPVAKDTADPHGICTDEGANSCGNSGVCDGQGGCSKYALGTTCGGARCEGGSMVPAPTCDGLGSCRPSDAIACAPYICSGNACKRECEDTGDCVGGNTCIGVSCGLRGLGLSCDRNDQCKSGHCTDGVCCNQACEGICRFCALPGSNGVCKNVDNNLVDPRAIAGERNPQRACIDEGAASCGRNGMCNGNGGCQLYASGTVCAPESCDSDSNLYEAASTCNGRGSCKPPVQKVGCFPFLCNGPRCGSACDGNEDCAPPNSCVDELCGKLPDGSVCNGDSECQNDHCEQGICCATACDGACESCKLTGTVGSCEPIAGGAPPRDISACPIESMTSCGNDGTCDGARGCRQHVSGTVCEAESCNVSTEVAFSERLCDGAGACVAAVATECDPFVCGATACRESCAADDDCQDGFACAAPECKLAVGEDCVSNAQCASGNCKQPPGRCFKLLGDGCSDDSECDSGVCDDDVCKLPLGVMCQSDSDCVSDLCDTVSSECRLPLGADCDEAEPEECASGVCDDDVCKLPLGVMCQSDDDCESGLCDMVASQCKLQNGESCNGNGDCGSGLCAGAPAVCADALPLGAACTLGNECGSGSCVDVAGGGAICCATACDSVANGCLTGNCLVDGSSCETVSCTGDFACKNSMCLSSCDDNSDCAAGATCSLPDAGVGGTCQQ